MIDWLIQRKQGNPNVVIGYFYCKYNDPRRSSCEEIAKSLIAQLLNGNQNCLDYLYDVASKSGEKHAIDKKSFSEILHSLSQCYDQVFFGIDGLDECEPVERKQAISLLQSLLRTSGQVCTIKILLCSCAEKDIERALEKEKRWHIKIKDLSAPIQTYVRIRLASLNQIFKFRASKLEQFALQISGQSEGMDFP